MFFQPFKNKVTRNKGNSLVEFPDNYVILDIETTGLSPENDSIIELSALKCENDEIIDKFSTLINPQFKIDEYITALTGITNEMLLNAPVIEDVIEKFVSFISSNIVIGHNVNFDINFIYDSYLEICNKIFNNDYVDLLRISRRAFPMFDSHKLSALSEKFAVKHLPTHRGYDDCMATYECYIYCKKYITENNIDIRPIYKSLDLRTLTSGGNDFDTSHQLYGKMCVFTGKLERLTRAEAAQLVVNIGGLCENNVTSKTNFLIMGNNDYCKSIKDGKSNKQKKAEKLILGGQDLQILPEDVFYELVFENV